MTKINKNVNSIGLTSNIKKSESNKEEKLKRITKDKLANQVRQSITRQKAILRDIKDSPPINQLGMMSSSSSIAPKSKPLPDAPIKNNFLPHNSLKVVARNKPLPPVPSKSVSQSKPQSQPQSQPQFQPQVQAQPQPQRAAIDIPKLDLGALSGQMALFKNAVQNNSVHIKDLVVELNKLEKGEIITNTTCLRFANSGMRVGLDVARLKTDIKNDVKLFASTWMEMIESNTDIKDEPWYEGVTQVANTIVKEWN